MNRRIGQTLLLSLTTVLLSCGDEAQFNFGALLNSNGTYGTCQAPDNVNCAQLKTFETFIEDSFERAEILPSEASSGQGFGWRRVINDNGRVISDAGGNYVDLGIFDSSTMGPAAHQNRALYMYGRQGTSVHNLYLISHTFDLSQMEHVVMEFHYLPIALEANEFFRLEVCNDSLDACGVGSTISVAGLNSAAWKPLFEMTGAESSQTLNGKNHKVEDWKHVKVDVFLENFQKPNFVFRFNARMNEGFKDNSVAKGLVDGLALDKVRSTGYGYVDGVDYLQIREGIYAK